MNTMIGTCRYCGQNQTVNAVDSEDADRRVIDDRVRRGVWEELGRGVAGQIRMEVDGIWH